MKIPVEIFLVIMLVIFIICGLMIKIYIQKHEILELKKQVDFYKERVGGLKYIPPKEE